jgi:hypothetical protein
MPDGGGGTATPVTAGGTVVVAAAPVFAATAVPLFAGVAFVADVTVVTPVDVDGALATAVVIFGSNIEATSPWAFVEYGDFANRCRSNARQRAAARSPSCVFIAQNSCDI